MKVDADGRPIVSVSAVSTANHLLYPLTSRRFGLPSRVAFSGPMAPALPSLAPLLFIARIFSLLVTVLVFVWALAFKSSFGHPGREDQIFDVLHPLFMIIGLILITGEAIFVHSWLPGSRNLKKSVHLSLQGLALASGISGIWTKFHWDRGFLANFHSLHSWMGLIVVNLFAAQWMMGFLSFWHWREVRTTRERVLPWHIFLGLYSYGLAVVTAETGLLEKLTLLQTKRNVPRKGPEAMVVNSLGVTLALLGGIVVLTAVSPKHPPSPPSLPTKQPFFSNSKLSPS